MEMPRMPFRVETEVLGLERITWLVHPDGNVRCVLRVEWLGKEPVATPIHNENQGV